MTDILASTATYQDTGDWFYPDPAIETFTITAKPQRRLYLPAYPGSMLRGAFGHGLRQRYCQCRGTSHQADCVYFQLFEGQRRAGQDGIPAVLFTPLDHNLRLAPQQPFRFLVHLIGVSAPVRTAVLSVIKTALLAGLGEQPVACQVSTIVPANSAINLSQQPVTLTLASPWLIKRLGQALPAAQFRIHDLLIALLRRQQIVQQQFALPLVLPSNQQLLQLADQLAVQAQLRDVSWQRHSQRQGTRHPLTGVQGQLQIKQLNHAQISLLGPLLANGWALHGGGKTALGLGALQVS